jgi:CheY-like chemotaxis protein
MVVDDNEDAREIYRSYLEHFTFEVVTVDSGKKAIQELDNNAQIPGAKSYGLILMDWNMPGMDGIETAVRIKENFKIKPQPKIIMLTAFGREEIMNKAEKAGLDGFLIKPVGQSVLFDTIMSAFGREEEITSRAAGKVKDYTEQLEGVRGASVLLVEDNEINQQVASELIEKENLIVSIANNGKEAVQAVQGWDYDIVLMDIQMPEMNGYEATAAIRKDPKFKDLPIVAMTAHAMAGDHEKSIEAGMNDHITKPIDPDQLFSTLVKWIKPGDRGVAVPVQPEESDADADIDIPDEIAGMDVATGMKRVGGNKKLYRKLLLSFRENHGNAAAEVREYLDKGDTETAGRLAHTVKGVAGNIAAVDVAERAAALEEAIKGGNVAEHESLLKELNEALVFVVGSLSVIESAAGGPAQAADGAPVDAEKAGAILAELKDLLEDDLSEAENRFESLKAILGGSEHKEIVSRLEKQMGEYDFDGVYETIETLSKKLSDATESGSGE